MKIFTNSIYKILTIPALAILTGCTASIPGRINSYNQENTSFNNNSFYMLPLARINSVQRKPIKGKETFFQYLFPLPHYYDFIEYGNYSDQVSQQLVKHGMHQTNIAQANYTVVIEYGISKAVTVDFCAPINLRIPKGYAIYNLNNKVIASYFGFNKDGHSFNGFTIPPNAHQVSAYNICKQETYSKKEKTTLFIYYTWIGIFKTSELKYKNPLPVYSGFSIAFSDTALSQSEVIPGMFNRIFENFPNKNVYNQETQFYLSS